MILRILAVALSLNLLAVLPSCVKREDADAGKSTQTKTPTVAVNDTATRMDVKLRVSGMFSDECPGKIRTALSELRGVTAVKADYNPEKTENDVFVSFHPDIISLEEIRQAIEGLGYVVSGEVKPNEG